MSMANRSYTLWRAAAPAPVYHVAADHELQSKQGTRDVHPLVQKTLMALKYVNNNHYSYRFHKGWAQPS